MTPESIKYGLSPHRRGKETREDITVSGVVILTFICLAIIAGANY